jgi:hypothetical protein
MELIFAARCNYIGCYLLLTQMAKMHHVLNFDCVRAGAWWDETVSLEHKEAWAAWVSRKS